MLAKKVGLALASLLATGLAYATVGPDSLLQNIWLDPRRAEDIPGELFSWDGQSIGGRECFLIGPGKHGFTDTPDGIPEVEARKLLDLKVKNWQANYKEWFGVELFSEVAIVVYCCNTDLPDPELATNLGLLMEADPDMTQARFRANCDGHSKMGNIFYCYWEQGGRKLGDRKLTLGTPHLGVPLAEWDTAESAIRKTYGLIADLAIQIIQKRDVDFEAPGHLWLTREYPPMMERRRRKPLDDTWYLYAGKIKPLPDTVSAKIVNATMLADAVVVGGGFGQEPHAYALSALLIQKAGEDSGSDGMVPVASAWAEGYAGKAHLRLMEGYDHSALLQAMGRQQLHAMELRDLIDFVPGSARSDVPGLTVDIPTLPEITDIWSDAKFVSDWSQLRCAAWTSRGDLILAESDWENPKAQKLPGKVRFATWWGAGLVVGLTRDNQTDLYYMDELSGLVSLTNEGGVEAVGASADDEWLVYVSAGAIVLRSKRNLAKRLVIGGVETDCELFVRDGSAWWYQGRDGLYELRSVALARTDAEFAETKAHGSIEGNPFRAGGTDSFVAYGPQPDLRDGEGTVLFANQFRTVPLGWWPKGIFDIDFVTLGRIGGIGEIDQVGVDSVEATIYMRFGRVVRKLDRERLADERDNFLQQAGERAKNWFEGSERSSHDSIAGEPASSQAFFMTQDLDEWAPQVAEGIEGFDIR